MKSSEEYKFNEERQNSKGQKFYIGVLVLVAVSIVLFVVQGMYFDSTGKIETEFAINSTHKDVLSTEGFAVRDEIRLVDGKNTAVLYKNSDRIYVPVVSDSVNVAINDVIAVSFSDEMQADAYLEIQQLKKKKDYLQHLKSKEDLNRINVIYLNSQIYSTVQNYSEILSSGNYQSLSQVSDSFVESLTSKQIATGQKYDFDSIINSYNEKIASLDASISSEEYVRSPFAGYFISEVDGYESTKSYDDVKDKIFDALETSTLISAQAQTHENAYGKIIGQHVWYLFIDIPLKDANILKTGKAVTVDFPERALYDVPMTVYSVSDSKDGKITVALKCKYLNEQLAVLRKEQINITIEKYNGFRISSEALVKNDEGIEGVYVLAGNVAKFTPVNVLYYGENFIIANKYIVYRTDKKGNKIIDEEQTARYREIKAYDRVIVKGNNIEDGKVID